MAFTLISPYNSFNNCDVKLVPWSVRISFGIPNLAKRSSRCSATDKAVNFRKGMLSGIVGYNRYVLVTFPSFGEGSNYVHSNPFKGVTHNQHRLKRSFLSFLLSCTDRLGNSLRNWPHPGIG